MWMITSTQIIGTLEDEFRTGIKEMKHHKVADSNEIYDFIIPLDLKTYKTARTRIVMLVKGYEMARRKFHKKNLKISDDIRRDILLLDRKLEDLDRLTDLIPEFGEDKTTENREKRQLATIVGASLASFLHLR